MFKEKVSVVRSLMVAGKLSILLVANPAYSNDISNPRFFEYRGGSFVNRVTDISFGWFRTLNQKQLDEYHQSLTHAVMMAENGQTVRWYRDDASGYAVPVMTWPTGSGYCRRIHVQAIAYGVEKTKTATACFDNAQENWRWVSDK